jgi:hypothetical protein
MDRLLSHYLATPCASTAARLVRHARAHGADLCRARSFDLGVLAEAEEVYVASRREARLADRRSHRAH